MKQQLSNKLPDNHNKLSNAEAQSKLQVAYKKKRARKFEGKYFSCASYFAEKIS